MAEARTLAPGTGEGDALVLEEPLSFWGGMDPVTGALIDAHHPQRGQTLARRVVAMPSGRGSSSTPSVLAEALRIGTGPAAVLLLEPDPVVALGSIVAAELYDVSCPVVVLDPDAYGELRTGLRIRVVAGEARATVEHA